MTEGLRYDGGKPRFDLLPPDAMIELAQLYANGAVKYNDNNWRLGLPWCKTIGAALRHIFKWMRGEDIDEETGCHHLICAAWNCLAIVQYKYDNVGVDDRYVAK